MSKAVDSLKARLEAFEQTWQSDDTEHRMDLAFIICRGLKRKGWTARRLAKRCGLTTGFVSHLMHGNKNFTSSTLGKVVNALGVKVKLVEVKQKKPR